MNYGYEFETKLLGAILNDPEFLVQIGDIIKSDYFSNQAGKWLITKALDYFKKYKKPPSLLVFKTEIEKIENGHELLRGEAISFLGSACSYVNSIDLPYVKDEAVNFCRNQEIKSAILDSVDLLKKSEFEQIKYKLDKALKVGVSRDVGYLYKDDFEARYLQSKRTPIATNWSAIDDLLQGGLSKGEMGVVIAPGGIGKSWVLVSIGAAAVKAGFTVIHYTLELNKYYVAKRYDSVLSGYGSVNLDLHKNEVYDIVNKLPGNLIIEEYPTRSASVLTIRAHLDRCISLDKKPHLIIVDYGALLRGNANLQRYQEVGETYEELRGIAAEYACPLWTAAQTNRAAAQKDIIYADDVADAYYIIAASDFVLSLSRKDEDKLAGTGRFHVIKNRNGPDGLTLPSRFNASNGRIDIFLNTSKDAINVRREMSNGSELVRKELGRKYFDDYLSQKKEQEAEKTDNIL